MIKLMTYVVELFYLVTSFLTCYVIWNHKMRFIFVLLSVPLSSLVGWTKKFDARTVEQGGCLIGRGGYADVFRGSILFYWVAFGNR